MHPKESGWGDPRPSMKNERDVSGIETAPWLANVNKKSRTAMIKGWVFF